MMSRLTWVVLPVLVALCAAPVQAQKKGKAGGLYPPKQVQKIRTGMANALANLANWCRKNKLPEEGKKLLAEAETFDAESPLVRALQGKISGADEASDGTRKSYDRKLKSVRKFLARQTATVTATEIKVARSSPCARQARTHPMRYLLSLPSGWSKQKKFHIVVTVDGAGSNFAGNHRSAVSSRGSKPFIILTPMGFTNTNGIKPSKYPYPKALLDRWDPKRMEFDENGLLAAIKDVQEDCNAADKFFITGFSGGGNLTWRMVFGHPDKLMGASPACANFSDPGAISKAPERKDLPVKAFQGDKDQYLNGKGVNLNADWANAEKIGKSNGFGNVTRVMLPGVGHSSCLRLAMGFFAEVLKASRTSKKGR